MNKSYINASNPSRLIGGRNLCCLLKYILSHSYVDYSIIIFNIMLDILKILSILISRCNNAQCDESSNKSSWIKDILMTFLKSFNFYYKLLKKVYNNRKYIYKLILWSLITFVLIQNWRSLRSLLQYYLTLIYLRWSYSILQNLLAKYIYFCGLCCIFFLEICTLRCKIMLYYFII